ncbi:hypothetical protein [Shimia sediminis]|uniref:hypothetical protein n=1 Tax=Shimia sediminis TaxID=2497945 RepID=UPI000F8CB52B|nr:hypothetical protein [Shimia sediminis]
MERIGAVVLCTISAFGIYVALMVIMGAVEDDWTVRGFAASVFVFGISLLILPTTVAHTLTALFPRILNPWRRGSPWRKEATRMFFEDKFREAYRVVGWFASIGAVLLLIYRVML